MQILGRVEARSSGMEARADAAQREVALGSEQQHDQGGREAETARGEPQADFDRDQRHRQSGDQLQGERRQECHPERTHRGGAVLLGDRADRVALCLRPTEQAQGREPFDDVEKVTAQLLQDGPLSLRAALGHPSDQDHEDRDERDGHGDEEGGDRIDREDDEPGDERDRHSERQCGEELTHVGLEFVDAGRRDRGFAAGKSARRAVTVSSGVVEHDGPQAVSRRPHRTPGRPFGHRRRGAPHGGNSGQEDEHPSSRHGALLHELGESVGEEFGLGDDGASGRNRHHGDDGEMSAKARNEPHEPDVDRPAPADVAHDRWTTGRCWVPIRLRNTQYVHPWYNSTIGVITRATMVITFKV